VRRVPSGVHARLRPLAVVCLTLTLAGCAAHTMPEVRTEADRLQMARTAMDKHQYIDAAELLKGYVQRNAGTAQVDGAICMLGECFLNTHDWVPAQEQFEKLLRDYPESDSAGSASFLLGDAFMGQSRPRDFDQQFTQRALDQWDEYVRRYPDHWRHEQAEQRVLDAPTTLARKLVDTADLYVKLRQYTPARIYYQRVIDDYHDTVPLIDAQVGLAILQARLGKFEEAIQTLRQIEETFPGRPVAARAAKERVKLEKKLAKGKH